MFFMKKNKNVVTKRIYWIDFARFLAILGVIVDHTNGILYTNSRIPYLSYYSVSLFILLMGITTFWSFERKKNSIKNIIKNKCISILIPYVIATFIYCVFYNKAFNIDVYIDKLIHFNASWPFYYVLLYIQLVVISPIVYYLVDLFSKKKNHFIYEMIGLLFVIAFSFFTTRYTNLFYIYGGGGKLFGGTYLILFYIGMLFAKYYNIFNPSKAKSFFLFLIFLISTIICGFFIAFDKLNIDKSLPFGDGVNPPSISLILYAILILLMVFFGEKLIINIKNNVVTNFLKKISFFGRHTLYIFLYHIIIRDILNKFMGTYDNIWLKRIVYFTLMIVGSLIIEYLLKKIQCIIKKIYNENNY